MLQFLDNALGVVFVLFILWLILRPFIKKYRTQRALAEIEQMDRERDGVDSAVADARPDWDGDTAGASLGRMAARMVGGRALEAVVKQGQRGAALGRLGGRMTGDLESAGACPTCGASAACTIVVEGEGRCTECQATWTP